MQCVRSRQRAAKLRCQRRGIALAQKCLKLIPHPSPLAPRPSPLAPRPLAILRPVTADPKVHSTAASPGDITRRELYFFNLYRCLEAVVYIGLVATPLALHIEVE